MPLYEYICQKCQRRTEVIQAFGERRIRICPHCGGKVKKAFSAPAIQFKGSGFYITDYAKGKTGDAGSSASGKDSGKSESGKTDSGKSDSGKSESGKSESGKSESGKSESSEKSADKKKETKESKAKKPAKD